jgi:hypothetical protein
MVLVGMLSRLPRLEAGHFRAGRDFHQLAVLLAHGKSERGIPSMFGKLPAGKIADRAAPATRLKRSEPGIGAIAKRLDQIETYSAALWQRPRLARVSPR